MLIYESTVIFSPELPADKLEELVEKVKKTIGDSQGTILLSQMLGKKKLAYPIKKFKEGSYLYLEISGPGTLVGILENFYKVHDAVIRYMTVKVEKKPQAPKPAVEPAQAPETSAASQEVKSDDQQQSTAPRAE